MGLIPLPEMPSPSKCLTETSAPQRPLQRQAAVKSIRCLLMYLPVMPNRQSQNCKQEIPKRELPVGLWPPATSSRQDSSPHVRSQKPVPAVHSQAAPQSLFHAKVRGSEGLPYRDFPPSLATLQSWHCPCRQAPHFSSSNGTDPPHRHSQAQYKLHMALLTHMTLLCKACIMTQPRNKSYIHPDQVSRFTWQLSSSILFFSNYKNPIIFYSFIMAKALDTQVSSHRMHLEQFCNLADKGTALAVSSHSCFPAGKRKPCCSQAQKRLPSMPELTWTNCLATRLIRCCWS